MKHIWIRWGLILSTLLAVAPAAAGPKVNLKIVTDVSSMDGLQAQLPLWAPGDEPRLVHEMTDRSRRTHLRVVSVPTGSSEVVEELVPGSRSSRLSSLGAAGDRADSAAVWWDEGLFFFLRAIQGQARLQTFDVAVRPVPDIVGRIDEVTVDPDNKMIYVAMEEGHNGIDVFSIEYKEIAGRPGRLSSSPRDVEHGLTLVGDRKVLYFIADSQEETKLAVFKLGTPAATEPGGQGAISSYELLSLAALDSQDVVIAYARRRGTGAETAEYVLLQIAGAVSGSIQVKVLVDDVYLPPGLAPRPALSDDGSSIYYVESNTSAHNPVVRLDRDTGKKERLSLNTRGHQEVSVAEYQGVPWIAVVAVGDAKGDDVGNHVYIGPLGSWPGW